MNVREVHAPGREFVEVRRGDLALRVQAFHIAITEVIAEDVDEVGFRGCSRSGHTEKRQDKGGEDGFHGQENSQTGWSCKGLCEEEAV